MHKQILPIFSMGIFCNRIKNNTLIVDLKKEKKELYLGIWRHYKIFCVNGNTGFRNESRIYYFIHLQNEKDYERKKSSSA